MPLQPRKRWLYCKYDRPWGENSAAQLHLYEIINAGSGIPTSATHVIIIPANLVQVGEGYALVPYDGIIALWNDTLEVALAMDDLVLGRPLHYYGAAKGTVTWDTDGVLVEVVEVGPRVTDIAIGDKVVVPMRDAYSVSSKPFDALAFHADSVAAKEV